MNKNGVYNAISYLVTPLLMIISTPILMKNIGVENYGLWIMIVSLISTFSMFQFGIGETMIKKASELNSLNKKNSLNKVITSGIITYILLGTIISCSIFLFSEEILNLLGTKSQNVISLKSIMQYLSILIFVTFLKEAFSSTLKSLERYDLVSIQNILISFIKNLLIIVVSFFLQNIIFLIITFLIVSIVDLLIIFIIWKKYMKKTYFLFEFKSWNYIFKYKQYAFYSGMQSLTTILFTQSDKFLIGAFVGLKEVAIYAAFLQIVTQIQQLLSSTYAYVLPKVSIMISKNKIEEVKIYFLKLFRINITISFFGYFTMLILGYPFINLWLNEIKNISDYINSYYLLVISYFFLSQNIIPHYFLNAMGKTKQNLFLMAFTYLFTFLLLLKLVPLYGLLGASISKALVIIPIMIYVLVAKKLIFRSEI